MSSLSEHDDDPQPGSANRGLWVGVLVVVVMIVFVLLHVLGVVGPSAHGG